MQLYADKKHISCVRKAVYNLLSLYKFQLVVQGKDFDVFVKDKNFMILTEYSTEKNKFHMLIVCDGILEKTVTNMIFKNQNDILKYLLDYI